jgi:nitrate/nitrite-specific signal transduction histidine kinase
MNKKILIVAISLLLAGSIALAEVDEVGSGLILPNSPLSFLENIGEWLTLKLTFNPVKKAELKLKYTSERLAEMKVLEEGGRLTTKLAEKIKNKYQNLSEAVQKDIPDLKAKGRDVSGLVQKLEDLTSRHIRVLEDVLAKVPEQARDAISKALEVSRRGHERAIEAITKEIEEGTIKEEELKPEIKEGREVKEALEKRKAEERRLEAEEVEELEIPSLEEEQEEIKKITEELETEKLEDLDKDIKTLETP